jgi:glycerol uptake facilitator-like aquaporin
VALLANAAATAAALYVLIVALAPISGAHFNPLVSLLHAVTHRTPIRRSSWRGR